MDSWLDCLKTANKKGGVRGEGEKGRKMHFKDVVKTPYSVMYYVI